MIKNTNNIFQWKLSSVKLPHQYSKPVSTVQTATEKRAYADLQNNMSLYERKKNHLFFALALKNILNA